MTREEWEQTAAGKELLAEEAATEARREAAAEARRARPAEEIAKEEAAAAEEIAKEEAAAAEERRKYERWFWALLDVENWDTKAVKCDGCEGAVTEKETFYYYTANGNETFRCEPGTSRRHYWFWAADAEFDGTGFDESLFTKCVNCVFGGDPYGLCDPWDDDSHTVLPPDLPRPRRKKAA